MTWFAKILAAVLVVSSGTTVHGQNSCFTDGTCDSGETDLNFVDCGLTDNDISDLNDCFEEVGRSGIEKIRLNQNGLTTIPSNLLQGMSALEDLRFTNNGITTIPSNLLAGMSALKELRFHENSITTIETGAFQHVASTLEFLNIGFNDLETIPPNLFAGMGAMIELRLRDNGLTSLPVDAFVGLTNLEQLKLHNNELTTLPAGLFDDVGSDGSLTTLNLSNNQGLQCIPATSYSGDLPSTDDMCGCTSIATCSDGVCAPGAQGFTCAACDPGVDVCDDPHMQGLRGQRIDWSGVDGGWYCLITDNNANIHVNVRLTAPLPEAFPDRQLITGLSIVSEGHSLTIEVSNPYSVDTNGCPREISPCLANGGLRVFVDGEEVDDLLLPSRHEKAVDGISVSASNLPVECRQFGGDTIWARMYNEMLQGTRQLDAEETFEDWVLSFDHMAAVDWCTQYIAQHSLADVQSNHAIFKIVTSAVTVRLNVGTNFQGDGDLDWDGRVLPDLEFWQMDVGLNGLSIESESLSGILGETARPVLDKEGRTVMGGYEAFRGTVEDYRVSGPLGTEFAMLNKM